MTIFHNAIDPRKIDPSVNRYIKGSVWRIAKDISLRGAIISVGSNVKIAYPRRRESNEVAIKAMRKFVTLNFILKEQTSTRKGGITKPMVSSIYPISKDQFL